MFIQGVNKVPDPSHDLNFEQIRRNNWPSGYAYTSMIKWGVLGASKKFKTISLKNRGLGAQN